MKFVVFTIFLMIAMAMAAFQAEKPAAFECLPKGFRCQKDYDCCRGMECVRHANVCVELDRVDPNDKRPIGPKMPY